MPKAERGMLLNDVTLHDENFFPTIAQTSDGQIYLVDGARTSWSVSTASTASAACRRPTRA